ncbi:TPA: hypothetical protein ACOVI5_003042, partial [Klebsiella oxytoca]
RICPGYASSAACGPVARAGALRRPRGKSAEWQDFPEAMLRICPGYASSAACGPVDRRRPRGKRAEWQNFPEAMLRICPGYASSAACGPVARLSAARAGGLSAILPKLAHQRLGLLLIA